MRAKTAKEDKLLALGRWDTKLRLSVKDAGGSWVDYTNLESKNWLDELEYGADLDEPVASGSVVLKREFYHLNLSPLVVTGNKINDPTVRFSNDREMKIEAAMVEPGGEPASGDWRLVFEGYIDDVEMGSDGRTNRIRGTFRDKGRKLLIAWLERNGRPDAASPKYYGNGAQVEDVINTILSDWASPETATLVGSSPGWVISNKWAPRLQSVFDAIKELADMIGWDLRYRYHAGSSAFRLEFFEPDRTKTAVDFTLGPDDYFNLLRAEVKTSHIRNAIRVGYQTDPADATTRAFVDVESAASITKYTRRWMAISEAASSAINSATEAAKLANAALNDLKDPVLELEVECPYLWFVEIGDLVRFSANGRIFAADQDLAVSGIRHRFSADGRARTVIISRGKPASRRRWWWLKAAIANLNPAVNTQPPDTPSVTVASSIRGGAVKIASIANNRQARMAEVHLSTSSGFTPSSSTLAARADGNRFDLSDLTPGKTYYVKVRTITPDGVVSSESTEQSFVAGAVSIVGALANSDGMPYAVLVDRATTNYLKNPSFETNVTDGWTNVSMDSLARITGAGNFIFGAAACRATATIAGSNFVSNDAVAASGETWTASVWLRKNANPDQVNLQIEFLNSGGAVLQTVTKVIRSSVATGSWDFYTVSGTATDATTAKVRVKFVAVTGIQNFDIDGVMLEKASQASSYCDGSLGDGFAWDAPASPHNSASSRIGGFLQLGALQTVSRPWIVYDDGAMECGGYTWRGIEKLGFEAYRSSSFAVATSTDTLVVFDGAARNSGGHFSVSTGKFTVPYDGIYSFDWAVHSVDAIASGALVVTALVKDSAVPDLGTSRVIKRGSRTFGNGSALLQSEGDWTGFLEAGDTIAVIVFHNHGVNRNFYGNTGSTEYLSKFNGQLLWRL